MNNTQVDSILRRCGYKSREEVINDACDQLAKTVINNMTFKQPKMHHNPVGFQELRTGPSYKSDNDPNDYEQVQRSYDRS